ncbi:uncharacterized protein LAESUDRAFT_630879, partial [Laetiporus sulphureus 93-53]
TTALLDSGAFSCYIDQRFAEKYGFKMIPLNQEIRILNADASPNKGGAITHRVVTSILIGKHRSTEKHNPRVDWEHREVTFSRC